MGELKFITPVENEISHPYGEQRRNRSHKGMDYASPNGTAVHASEIGRVIRASFHDRKEVGKGSYGNVIVVDHTPNAEKNERHVYTLYAHLEGMSVGEGHEVEKDEIIGTSGNTGTVEYFRAKDKGYSTDKAGGFHLHFEVIDAPFELNWQKTGAIGVSGEEYREDPIGNYLGRSLSLNGTVGDHPISEHYLGKILDRMGFRLDDAFRLQIMVDGKNIGYLGKGNDTIETKVRV